MTGSTDHDNAPLITRRRVLGAAAAGASALAVSGTGLGRAAAAVATNPLRGGVPARPGRVGDRTRRRRDDGEPVVRPHARLAPGRRGRPDRRYRDLDGVRHDTWHLDTFTGEGFHDPEPLVQRRPQEFNDGTVTAGSRRPTTTSTRSATTRPTISTFYRNAAPYWTVCDHFFASIMGPTYPNRFYMHTAQTDRQHEHLRREHAAHDLGLAGGRRA